MATNKNYIELLVWINKELTSCYVLFLSNKLTKKQIKNEVNRNFPKYYKFEIINNDKIIQRRLPY
jgi:hypothetical protein